MQQISLPSRFIAGLVLFAVVLIVVASPTAAGAASGQIVVANTNDSGAGSLRQAIAEASPGEIVVVPKGTYKLTSGELAVSKSLTIAGADPTSTTIDAQGASRVFHTSGAASKITISGLEIFQGKAVPASG